jgi:hypothetical protein
MALGAVGETIYTPTPPGLNGTTSLSNGGALKWYYTSSTSGCGPYGGTDTVWSLSYFTYADSTGTYPMPGTASYIYSTQQQYCPPTGPQPPALPIGPTGPYNNIMVNVTAGYGGSGTATIQ